MRTRFGALGHHRPMLGIGASIVLHALLILALLFVGRSGLTPQVKRGEPLFVELPNIPEPAPRGNPAAREPAPPAPAPKPVPPARAVAPSKPAPPVIAKARPAEPAPAPPKPAREPDRVATARAPEPAPAPKVEDSAPAQEAAKAAPPTPAPPRETTPSGPAADPRVAMAPSPKASAAPDLRALRRGGAGAPGGTADGRGGIEGEPIPLDSKDPRYNDYLDRIRRMIKEKWGFPCERNPRTRECEYKTAVLVIEFGITREGVVPFVNVLKTSGYQIYDDYAVNAIKLAAPFPQMPTTMGGPKGVPIVATFSYMVDSSLVNLLR